MIRQLLITSLFSIVFCAISSYANKNHKNSNSPDLTKDEIIFSVGNSLDEVTHVQILEEGALFFRDNKQVEFKEWYKGVDVKFWLGAENGVKTESTENCISLISGSRVNMFISAENGNITIFCSNGLIKRKALSRSGLLGWNFINYDSGWKVYKVNVNSNQEAFFDIISELVD